MMYKAMFLPVDKPLEDGCKVIKHNGEVFEYIHFEHQHMTAFLKTAELFIVSFEYNIMVVMGKPSECASKWLAAGMEIKAVDCVPVTNEIISIKCPTCHKIH